MLENFIVIVDLLDVGEFYCNQGISAMMENFIVIVDLRNVETGIDRFYNIGQSMSHCYFLLIWGNINITMIMGS